MKTTKIIFLTALIAVLSNPTMFAQTYEWQKPPQSGEKEIALIIDTINAGFYHRSSDSDLRRNYSNEQAYERLLNKAKKKYETTYPNFALRNFKLKEENKLDPNNSDFLDRHYYVSSSIVIPTNDAKEKNLSKAIDKALIEVREGSRIAIDQIRVINGMNREDYKDEIVEILLDKGFKVVAKEYLEKLYEEQQSQQSGIFNERTTVKENNLSAVGYYMNVKLSETALRIQVINVSTGEYEGNVTIKLTN